MRIHVIGVDHRPAPLQALATLAPASELAKVVMARHAGVAGAVLLSTCNRFELVVDAADTLTSDDLLAMVRECVKELAPDADDRALNGLRTHSGDEAVAYLFEVAAGLHSAVIGDKQVAGQLRRAYELASERGQCTASMHRLFHDCLTTSRKVASQTSLGAAGRSAAGVGLDLVTDQDLRGTNVLLIGTGSFARVVVAELTDRRVGQINCWSASGRAEAFAEHHPVNPLASGELATGLHKADIVVTCSGNGALVSSDILLAARPELGQPGEFPIIDLSLGGDLTVQARELPGVRYVGLDEVSKKSAEQQRNVIDQAIQVVHEGVHKHLAKERSRAADPVVMALRSHVNALVDQEIARIRREETPENIKTVEKSLRHVTGVLLHTPMVRAAQYAEEDRLDDCVAALDTLFGIEVDA